MGVGMIEAIRKNPPIMLLVGAVTFGLGIAGATTWHAMRNDPTLLLVNKKARPHPWLDMDQTKNIKFYAVNNKFDRIERKGYHDDI
ncbi:hypothetical protein BC830DRAFT_1157948 [Chytriomyces sp. MP71]|nr:hypothetical protein BC830DRAFT_1157948 [Chytriomyces sp. MP71]